MLPDFDLMLGKSKVEETVYIFRPSYAFQRYKSITYPSWADILSAQIRGEEEPKPRVTIPAGEYELILHIVGTYKKTGRSGVARIDLTPMLDGFYTPTSATFHDIFAEPNYIVEIVGIDATKSLNFLAAPESDLPNFLTFSINSTIITVNSWMYDGTKAPNVAFHWNAYVPVNVKIEREPDV